MTKTLLKIGIVLFPIAIWLGFSIFAVNNITKFLIDNVIFHPTDGLSFGYGMEFSILNIMPVLSFVLLGIANYLSIKLWIKYIHN